jgi:hypothetical protein
VPEPEHDSPSPVPALGPVELSVKLAEAAQLCRESVADYCAGVLDDDELRVALEGCGLAPLADGGWLLRLGPHPERP